MLCGTETDFKTLGTPIGPRKQTLNMELVCSADTGNLNKNPQMASQETP